MEQLSIKYKFKAKLWLYSGASAWHFITLGAALSKKIKAVVKDESSAWGSVKVLVRVKDFEWQTSIFPDTKIGSYLLPVKKQVRKKLSLRENDLISGTITIKLDRESLELI